MKVRSLFSFGIGLAILGTGSLLSSAKPALAQEVLVDNRCRPNQSLDQFDSFSLFYKAEFISNGQNYWFYAARYQDGGALLCVSKPNFSQAKPLNELESIQFRFIEEIVKDPSNNGIFVITIAEGNNFPVPKTVYQLDLTSSNTPVVERLPALLQKQGILEPGDSVLPGDGSLFDVYTFEGYAGQSVTITLQSLDFDPYLILLDKDGNQIADNDDLNESNQSSGLTVTLPNSGSYFAVVNGYDSNSRGEYILSVNASE